MAEFIASAFDAVLFDIGGVLEITGAMDFGDTWERKLELSSGAITVDLAELWIGGAVGDVSTDQLRQQAADRLSVSVETVDQMLEDMWDQYLGEPDTRLFDWLHQHRATYKTGLVSNSFIGARERENDKNNLSGLVDTIVYSHEVGSLKPDAKIYLEACQRLDVTPKRCIFVDDSPVAIEGAENLGMTAIHHQQTDITVAHLDALIASR